MKIAVLGASQGTGAEAVKAAVARGHQVVAFARSPEKLVLDHPNLTRMRGNFHDRASVDEAVRGQNAVLVTASATSLRAFRDSPRYFSQGTQYAIDAMKAHGVRRLVVLSAMGTGASRKAMPWLVAKLLVDFLLKLQFEDHERQEDMVRASQLDWVIARPGRLTNGPARKRYLTRDGFERLPTAISRADVADFMVNAAESDAWIGKAVQLGG
jgi:uncharacterized protein YbjT (DUF2867 family)